MTKTRLYIARHGKTMFNTLGRAQGWSDTPLTQEGERGVQELGIGLKKAGIDFDQAVSSDSGRAIQSMGIILDEMGLAGKIPYRYDKRIREWCFGSFDGAYDGDLFFGVLPRVFQIDDFRKLSLMEMAEGIVEVDTTGWAESWEKLSKRIKEGFEAIAKDLEAAGGGNAIVVSHGMTITTLIYLIDPKAVEELVLDNGSVTVVEYEEGTFTIKKVGDLSYRQVGAQILEEGHE
ncbi:histidine phosphatase family protein [Streptococcus lactarius]|uniref:Histidine phosphatase family protein n=1 Tax=Streptococcus lactarius TaxID=684066 RepID=A0A9X1BBD4_9STRE|nr:histidine phosphatase family protein [Streptococcus lactarius]MBK4780198.1 histidine phosphatase family protein [Streptococcus lactarius]QUB39240.1 histidine phosphatase family protein [Streptococcus lactarius]